MGGPLDPREVKTARENEYSAEAEARARTGRNPFGLKWIDTNRGSAQAATLPFPSGVYGGAP